MINEMEVTQLAKHLGAEYDGPSRNVSRVSTDSRSCQKGDLFVALKGARFDAHDYLQQVQESGVAAVVVEHAVTEEIPQLLVDDSLLAYGMLGKLNRQAFSGAVVGLTGSNGKTTCKQMIASILSTRGATQATEQNYNNEIGVPKTLLSIEACHDYAVVEMGAANLGDIDYVSQLVSPDVALITTISPVHVQGFGSLQGIVKTKGEIIANTKAKGTVVLPKNVEGFEYFKAQLAGRQLLTFAIEDFSADVVATQITMTATGVNFRLNYHGDVCAVRLPLLGLHNVENALASAACSLAVGLGLKPIAIGLEQVKPVAGRLQIIDACKPAMLIDDSYNASPSSVRAAIDVLATQNQADCRSVLILGTMAELGEEANKHHLDVALYAKQKNIHLVVFYGDYAQAQATAFGDQGVAISNAEQLLDYIACEILTTDVVLVKGSRSSKMETFVTALTVLKGD